jgi:hypothetical protein
MLKDKELRGYIGAATVFLLVMGLLLFLAFFEIPDTNNDIFKVIVGMLVGSLEALKAKNEALEDKVSAMVVEKDKLEALLRDLQTEVIDKLSITGEKFEFKKTK